MNVKIQGGGNGTYANTGSCVAVTNYLQHEDLERMKKGEEVQPFFNQFRNYVSAREVTFKIDNNKAKLSRMYRCKASARSCGVLPMQRSSFSEGLTVIT